jgi:hypothetical protein
MTNTLKNAIEYQGYKINHDTLKGGSKIWNAYKPLGPHTFRLVGSDVDLDALKAKLDKLN